MIKDQDRPAPEAMQAVWEWEHERQIDETAKINQLLAMYKQ